LAAADRASTVYRNLVWTGFSTLSICQPTALEPIRFYVAFNFLADPGGKSPA